MSFFYYNQKFGLEIANKREFYFVKLYERTWIQI